jgi:ATP-dependent helicase Lhr and Lhr-like helicase
VTVSSDLINDVPMPAQADYILLRVTGADDASVLFYLRCVAGMLRRVKGRIVHMALTRVSPDAVSLLLGTGRSVPASPPMRNALLAEPETITAEAPAASDRLPVGRRHPVSLPPSLVGRLG